MTRFLVIISAAMLKMIEARWHIAKMMRMNQRMRQIGDSLGELSWFCGSAQLLDMVDNSLSHPQTPFGLFFVSEQPSHHGVRLHSVFLWASSPIAPQHAPAPTSGLNASQVEIGNNGHESTSRAVQRLLVLPAAIAGVRCR